MLRTKKTVLRAIMLPPAGRPKWVAEQPSSLLYLSWGKRDFERHPVKVTSHTGWVYFFLERGSATFISEDHEICLNPGAFCIIHPDCANGWERGVEKNCYIRTWVWSESPTFPALQVKKGAMKVIPLNSWQLAAIRRIHADCLDEVVTGDQCTHVALPALRQQLDILLDRSTRGAKRAPHDPIFVAESAANWLRNHLETIRPAVALCQYLNVSSATLHRAMVSRFGSGVRQFFVQMKVSLAMQWRADGMSLNEASVRLGYHHANDLSRAIKRARLRSE